MSGGSYDYIYSTLMNECSSRMFDPEMNEMILAKRFKRKVEKGEIIIRKVKE